MTPQTDRSSYDMANNDDDLRFIGAISEVLVLQPNYEGPDAEEHLRAFWEAHDADPAGVVIVVVDDQLDSVFSTYRAAVDYAHRSGSVAIVVPKRIDDPAWGNTELQ